MHTVLFLCTGNYYRSRFAEIYFNELAADLELPWRADSRGLALELGAGNVGPLSPHTRLGLQQRGIPVTDLPRYPKSVVHHDFSLAHRIIALKEAEHRPMMEDKFPEWADRIEYWHVDDVDCAEPELALAEIEVGVQDLILRIRKLPNL